DRQRAQLREGAGRPQAAGLKVSFRPGAPAEPSPGLRLFDRTGPVIARSVFATKQSPLLNDQGAAGVSSNVLPRAGRSPEHGLDLRNIYKHKDSTDADFRYSPCRYGREFLPSRKFAQGGEAGLLRPSGGEPEPLAAFQHGL